MRRRFAIRGRGVIVYLVLVILCLALSRHSTWSDESNGAGQPVGAVRGHVRYQADPQRPWRLGRYYIKNRRSGELAEALVAIHDRDVPADPPSHEPRLTVVDQKDFQFSPETVAIRSGDSIEFQNSDGQAHNVRTTHDRQSFNVNMPPGGRHVQTFAFAGGIRKPYQIGCVFHSAMRSWVFVFDHPWYQLTNTNGEFELRDLPVGTYRIEVVHPAGELRTSKSIEVKPGEITTLNFELTPDNRADKK